MSGSKKTASEWELKVIAFGSPLYRQALDLRNAVLRYPLGRELDQSDLEGEHLQGHFGFLQADGFLIACVSTREMGGGNWKIRQMAVAPSLQKQGIGSLLLRHVEAYLHARGARHFQLHARVSARGFYEANGYQARGEIFEEVGIAHLLMEKKGNEG